LHYFSILCTSTIKNTKFSWVLHSLLPRAKKTCTKAIFYWFSNENSMQNGVLIVLFHFNREEHTISLTWTETLCISNKNLSLSLENSVCSTIKGANHLLQYDTFHYFLSLQYVLGEMAAFHAFTSNFHHSFFSIPIIGGVKGMNWLLNSVERLKWSIPAPFLCQRSRLGDFFSWPRWSQSFACQATKKCRWYFIKIFKFIHRTYLFEWCLILKLDTESKHCDTKTGQARTQTKITGRTTTKTTTMREYGRAMAPPTATAVSQWSGTILL